VPLSALQSTLLKLLASQRSPESYVAGGSALNRQGPRRSQDIDIFHDRDANVIEIAEADVSHLREAGFVVTWLDDKGTGRRSAIVTSDDDSTILEWVADADFRFFPTQADETFGFVLHPVDLATNKASAAADRRVPRDIVDLLTIHETILPLGAVVNAAVGRFPGTTPEQMLAEIVRNSRFTAEEFQSLATEMPVDPPDLHRRIRAMIEDARTFLSILPTDEIGVIFLENGYAVQPDPTRLSQYVRRHPAPRGYWPSSSEIGSAMLERHRDTD
jgi:hypothetical protein